MTCRPIRIILGAALTAILVLAESFPAAAESAFDPPAVYLTWRQDPTSTMVIHWHSPPDDVREVIEYREVDDGGDWHPVRSWMRPMMASERTIHMAELGGLAPATEYEFRWGSDSESYRFQTMPLDASAPVRFVVGGDTAPLPIFGQMNAVAASHEPLFAVIGGDIAYGDANPEYIDRWYSWFEQWKEHMVTPTGRLVPVVVAIGNHEVAERYVANGATHASAPWFFSLFGFPAKPGYNVLDFGDYMSLIALDTGHVNLIEGRQTEWLEGVLAARADVPHVFPFYHVPGFPSFRDFDGRLQTQVREHWSPLFEEHGVRAAFEHHDHTFKRTHPIRNGEIHPEGVVYLGDGAWSVPVREVVPADDAWYLAESKSVNHVFLVTLEGEKRTFQALDVDGVFFDEIVITGNEPLEVPEEALAEAE